MLRTLKHSFFALLVHLRRGDSGVLIVRRTVVLVLLTVCVTAHSEQSKNNIPPITNKPEDREAAKEYSGPQQNVTVGFPSAINVTVGGKLEVEANEQSKRGQDEASKLPEWLMAIFAFLLVCVTAYLTYYTKRLWGSTSTLVVDAERNSQIELRAYVCVKGAEIAFKPRNAPSVTVQITNFGKTPAYNVRQWIHIWIEEHPLSIALPEPKGGFGQTDAVLAPGNSMFLPIRKEPPVSPEDAVILCTKHGTIYVYGRIEYRDIFSKDRWTNFRLICGGSEPGEEKMKTDSAGNDTSESQPS